MKYRTDLILGKAFCIFIFFYFLDSGLSVLNGLQFYFWLRTNDVKLTNLQCLCEVCHFPHFHDKRQTKITL